MRRLSTKLGLLVGRGAAWLKRQLRLRWSDATTVLIIAAIFYPAVFALGVYPLAAIGWCLGLLILISVHTSARQMEQDAEVRKQIDKHLTEALELLKKDD